jgi:hypothetical protein
MFLMSVNLSVLEFVVICVNGKAPEAFKFYTGFLEGLFVPCFSELSEGKPSTALN